MFGFFKKESKFVAPIDGKVMNLSDVPDPVFAEKMAGDGVAIDTTGDTIVARCAGELTLVLKTYPAYLSDSYTELLVHIGIDTVSLNGEGFERLQEQGTTVKAGTPIIKINRDIITGKGLSLITPVLVTNVDNVKDLTPVSVGQNVTAGNDTVLTYKVK